MILIAYTTHPTLADAQHCANHLLQLRIVACANIMPVESAYWWQGNINNEPEFVALFKTRIILRELLEKEIKAIHTYQIPCIVTWQANANEDYENWINEQTTIL